MQSYVRKVIKSSTFGMVLAVTLSAHFSTVKAQEETAKGKSNTSIEEIVVTASKRGQSLIQKTPITVTALQGSQLIEAGQTNFMQYFGEIPGLSVNNQGPGDKQYIIRGIQSAGAGTSSVYFGEIVITGEGEGDHGRQPDINTYDLNRIEVLKGPQGTTFGSSSLAGTIRFMPNEPDYDAFSGEVVGGLNSTNHSNDIGYMTEGYVNVPLIKDKLAVRAVAVKNFTAGYIDNKFKNDANSEDTTAFRGMVKWKITDELEFSGLAMYQHMNAPARNFYNDSTFLLPLSPTLNGQPLPEKYYSDVLTDSGFDDKIDMYNAKLELNKSWGTFTATSSLFHRITDGHNATSAASEVLFGLPADQNPGYLGQDKDRKIWTNEVRFSSHWNSPFQLLSGVFYQTQDKFYDVTYNFTDPVTGRKNQSSEPPAADRTEKDKIDELAFFNEVEWTIIPRLRVTGGFRWFDINVQSQANSIIGYIYKPGSGLQPLLKFGQSDVIFKGNVSFDVTDDILAYAQVAEGYRSGGANDQSAEQITDVIIPAGFGSDSLINYEGGLKTSWLDHRLVVDGAVYYIDWSDIQVEERATNSQGLSFAYRGNGGKASVKGFELSATAYPTDGLSISTGLNYLNARLDEDLPIPSNGMKGDKIPNTPDVTAFISGRYEHPLMDGRFTGFVGGDWTYRGETSNRFRPDDAFARKLSAYSILNLRAGLQTLDGWEAIIAVNNVFDANDVISYSFDFQFPPLPGVRLLPDNKVRPWPRQFSLTIRKQFD